MVSGENLPRYHLKIMRFSIVAEVLESQISADHIIHHAKKASYTTTTSQKY
jgi:hypothetical protein